MSGSYSSGYIIPNNITTESKNYELSLSFIIIFVLILSIMLILKIGYNFTKQQKNIIAENQNTTDI